MESNTISASVAQEKFREFLERAKNGEGFAITLNGVEVAKLIPSKPQMNRDIASVIASIKANRICLNPPGLPKLNLKDLVNEGRP